MKLENSNLVNELPSITISISTISKNLFKFIKTFNFSNLVHANEVIIIVQGEIFDEEIYKIDKKFIIIQDENIGISNSRNIAISNASCDYIWFLDDDIIMYKNSILSLKKHIAKNLSDIYTVRMNYENTETPYKRYSNRVSIKRMDSLKVSSVELIVSRQFLNDKNIKFNKNIGLGTMYPSSEENIFYLDAFDNNAKINHIAEYLIAHQYIDRKKNHFSNPNILFAKGIFCKRYGGVFGFIILLYFAFKVFSVSINLKLLIHLLNGYFDGRKYIDNA